MSPQAVPAAVTIRTARLGDFEAVQRVIATTVPATPAGKMPPGQIRGIMIFREIAVKNDTLPL